jgi:membrane-associated phospholipid phosphatase
MIANHREQKQGILLVDWVVAGYNLVFGIIWITQIGRVWFAILLAAAHLVGLTLPWLFMSAPQEMSRALRTLREIYPLLFLAVFWPELDILRPVLSLQSADAPIAALDLFVFRVPLHDIWLPNMAALWFSEIMYLAYEGYYLLVFLPPLVLLFQRRQSELRDTTLRLVLAYLICFVTYALLPVDGPHFVHEPFQGPHTSGFFYGINQTLQASGDSLGCSFPSSHVAAAVSSAYIGWLYFPRWIAILMGVEALGVALATVYTQNHYAIDSLAGLLLALVVQTLIVPALYRKFGTGAKQSLGEVPA